MIDKWNKDVCDAKHKVLEKDISMTLETQEEIKRSVRKLDELADKTNYKIDSTKDSINSKIDAFDDTLKGNEDKKGVFEQIRYLQKQVYILFGILGIMFGGEFLGINYYSIKNFIFKKPNTEIVNINKNDKQIEEEEKIKESENKKTPEEIDIKKIENGEIKK